MRVSLMMAANICNAKKVFRKEVKSVLFAMTDEQRRTQSQKVVEKVLNHQRFKDSGRVSVFLSLNHEINTIPILEEIFKSSKTCFVPQYDVGNKKMKMLHLKSMEDYTSLPTTKWNIKQPDDDDRDEALETGGLDLIVVPGVAFTKRGKRLGNGGGFYDRYLKLCRQHSRDTYVMAVCFTQQLYDDVPVDTYDVPVDEVVSAND